jgi:hypothetical protein
MLKPEGSWTRLDHTKEFKWRLETPKQKKASLNRLTLLILARPERFELPTARFVAEYSIQLSYGRFFCHRLRCNLVKAGDVTPMTAGFLEIVGASLASGINDFLAFAAKAGSEVAN